MFFLTPFITGAMSDPWELPGLAHFLEHMLFLGTEKVTNRSLSWTEKETFISEESTVMDLSVLKCFLHYEFVIYRLFLYFIFFKMLYLLSVKHCTELKYVLSIVDKAKVQAFLLKLFEVIT